MVILSWYCSWPWSGAAATAVVFVCLGMAVLKVLEVLWWKPRRLEEHFNRQGIKGPPYKFFVGNVREMVSMMMEASSKPMMPQHSHNILPRVLSFYYLWKKTYGSTYLLWFGPKVRLTVADPDLIREIFVSRAEFFDRYEAHPLIRRLEGEGLVSLRGKKWAHHRKIITPSFHMDNLKLLIPHIGRTVVAAVEKWSQEEKVEVELSDWFQCVTEDAITRASFGGSYDEGKPIFRLQAQLMVYAAEAFHKVLIPGYRFLPTKKNRESWKLDKEIREGLLELIRKRREIINTEEEEEQQQLEDDHHHHRHRECASKDLLGLLIRESEEAAGKYCRHGGGVGGRGINGGGDQTKKAAAIMSISAEEIVEECKTFFFAGKQTTTNLLTWTTVMLAMHHDWQQLARDEVVQVCGLSRDIPSKEQLLKLKKLGMIVNETLRLYPPAVATIRRAKADVELGEIHIPRDTELLIPIIAIHHDATLWGPDAAKFNPARFTDGVARAARHPQAFIPFGLGARTCIGQNLALLEVKLTLAILLQRFSFELSPSYVHAPTVLMLLYPQYGAPVVFRPLSPTYQHKS